MALTESEKTELKNDILNAIKAESQGVNELTEVTSLDNIKSLPALRGTELVSAPLSLLGKPATDAAAIANAAATNANNAATNAAQATSTANNAAATANEKAGIAQAAAETASGAAKAAQAVVSMHESTALAALEGATARFGGFIEIAGGDVDFFDDSEGHSPEEVRYSPSHKLFVVQASVKEYYSSWPGSEIYNRNGVLLKDKAYLFGDVLYVWSAEEGGLVEISGSGGGNTLNVSEAYPLESGYYTLATAIIAVEEKRRGKGRCITYEVSQGKWETKQFVGTSLTAWEQPASWEDFGGAGTMKSLTVNGEKKVPDSEGNVDLTIDKLEVDESLNAESTNPVQNAAVAAKLSELEANTIFGADAELSDDESTVRLTLTNKSGAEVVAVDLPAGGGSGGGDTSTTRIVLGASVDNPTVKEGGSVKLTWSYDHQYTAGDEKGESTGQKATVQISVKRGATTTYSETIQEVSKGTYTLDLTKYLLLGTSDIYVVATATDPSTGKTQKKQAYVSVKSVTLSLL